MAGNIHDEDAALIDTKNDLVSSAKGKRDSRGKGNDGKLGGKSGGGGSRQGREVMISKALSKLLRHDAEKEGLVLDREGFAKLDQVMDWKPLRSLNVTFSDIEIVVMDNAKQRFTLRADPDVISVPNSNDTDPSHWLIRANQGHSIALESAALLQPITLEADNIPDIVVHGTYYAFYPVIVASGGLRKMGRNHVHCSTGVSGDLGVISGMRSDAEILIYINIRKSLEDGVLWWLSDNGVVLTEGDSKGLVATKYWKKVEGRQQDVGVLWEDGVEIAELPQSVRGRKAPIGKGPRVKREGQKLKGKDVRKDRGWKGMKELDTLEGEGTTANEVRTS